MPQFKTNRMGIKGICCALPDNGRSVYDIGSPYFPEESIRSTADTIGVKTIYEAKNGQTASDLCFEAADRLILELGWNRETIDGILFISQTPDYKLPSTSCVLQHRLGLSVDCLALDINLGCSGFLYGLFTASQFIETGTCKRVLLLVGDTLRQNISPQDRGLTFIISDAGSAIAVEADEAAHPSSFIVHTDGSGYQDLIIPAGGYRFPSNKETCVIRDAEQGNKRSQEHFFMDGMAVFTFAIKRVPMILDAIKKLHGWQEEDVERYLLHQANAYMVQYISKRAKISSEKIPINIERYGNTNASTIPLLFCDLYGSEIKQGSRIILSGFGVGLSWGAAAMTLGELKYKGILFI